MQIRIIANGWLVSDSDPSYIGRQMDEHFCATKEEVLNFISNKLKTNAELQAQLEAMRKKEMEERAAYIAGARVI